MTLTEKQQESATEVLKLAVEFREAQQAELLGQGTTPEELNEETEALDEMRASLLNQFMENTGFDLELPEVAAMGTGFGTLLTAMVMYSMEDAQNDSVQEKYEKLYKAVRGVSDTLMHNGVRVLLPSKD